MGETISLLPTLTPSQRLRNVPFTMKDLAEHALYVNNIHAKFRGHNIYTKEKNFNVQTSFTIANLDTLPRIDITCLFHGIVFQSLNLC